MSLVDKINTDQGLKNALKEYHKKLKDHRELEEKLKTSNLFL
jgi:hypothetical protein